jgi:PKD repeat protein
MKKSLLVISLALQFVVLGAITHTYHSQQMRRNQFDDKPYVAGEMLVQTSARGEIKRIIAGLPSAIEAKVVEEVSDPMRVWLIQFSPQTISHDAMMDLLYAQREVTLVDYNYYVEMRSIVPNDPQFVGQQWHHRNTGQTGGTVDADIDSDLAWEITTGGTTATGEDIVVCIIESANLNHTDLEANKWVNPFEIAGNGIDDDGNGYIDDVYGWNPGGNNGTVGYGTNSGGTSHGTNCAGMMGAVGNNGVGVSGANWDLKIMIVTVGNLTQANVIASYTYPLKQRQRWNNSNGEQGAFVVATSASWGIDQANAANYPLWCNFYDTLGKYGIINIGATSNSNINVDTQGDMPTGCSSPYMIGVGRTDHNDGTAGGFGKTTIELGAPGINVRTTANSNGYTTTTGTSFSCPLTAGVVALAFSIPCTHFMEIVKSDPQLGADMVRQALLDGVDQKPNLTNRFITGGRLNARNTLDELMTATFSTMQADFTTTETSRTVECTNNSSSGTYLWDFGDGNTSTDANPTHTYANDGTFTICLNVTDACGTVSLCKDLQIVNSGDNNIAVVAIPNPVSEVLFVHNKTSMPITFVVYDSNGRLIQQYTIEDEVTEINVKEWSSALYFYHITDENGTFLQSDKFNVIK